MKKAAVFIILAFLYSCSNQSNDRWYTTEQVNTGRQVYEQNCMVCHGANGVGDPNWEQKNPDGTLPPPPLDETAHSWHHGFAETLDVINKGRGAMPGFQNTLNNEEKEAVIAYIHSLWPDEIYKEWDEKVNNSNSHEGH